MSDKDEDYRQWHAVDREDYMHKKGGVKGTSLFTLGLLIENLDKLSGGALDQLITWANGDPGKNFGSDDSEQAIRIILPSLPRPPREAD